MNINRRVFITLAIGTLFSFTTWKFLFEKDKNLKIFIRRYSTLIPLEDVKLKNQNIDKLKREINMKLNIQNVDVVMKYYIQKIKNEYSKGNTVLLNNWIVSKTESDLLVLKKRYV